MKLESLYNSILEENKKTGTFYYTPRKDKLPNDMVMLFDKLAKQQRHIPEETMLTIVHKYRLRWYGNLLEHLGDLIHGFADAVNFNGASTRDLERKLQSAQTSLSTNLSGNLADLEKQHNIEAGELGISYQSYMSMLEKDLDKYVAAHYQLPAYNEIHLICKKITTSLGAMQFSECKRNIDLLLKYNSDGTLFKRSLTITRNNSGRIVEVKR